MPRRSRGTPPDWTAAMEDGVATWQRLQHWAAAAELLYAPNSPVNTQQVPGEPHMLVVARRIATTMARLNNLCEREAQVVLTPREALLELADTVRFALVSFHAEVLSEPIDSPSVASVAASYIAQRTVPRVGIVEGLHVITWISVKLRVEFFVEQLRQRLRRELADGEAQGRDAAMMTALRTTQTLLEDFETLYESVLVTFPCVQLLDVAPAVSEALLPVLAKQYYQLSEWVAEVEASASLPPITETSVQSINVSSATVVLRRTDISSPWGLLFNDCGRIVDVDIALRGASPEGEELHRMLRRAASGVAVLAVNSTDVPRARKDGDAAVVRETIARATRTNKRLVIRLAAEAFRESRVKELAFFVPDQGGEGSSGQRATIVLHRADRRIAWNCVLSDDLVVHSISRHSLSAEAKAFFTEYKKRVRLMSVNGVEVTTPEQTAAVAAAAETLVLNFVVVTPHTATAAVERPAPEHVVEQSGRKHSSGREAARLVHAEDVDAAADAVFAADADEAEELAAQTAEPLAEEEDVKETFPALADEDAPALEGEMGGLNSIEEGVREEGEEEEKGGEKGTAGEGSPELMDEEETMAVPQEEENREAMDEEKVATTERPLLLDNDVAIDLLTPREMVIRRTSPEKKWGLSLEQVSGKSGIEMIRIKALPERRAGRGAQQRHPFYQVFEKPPAPTEWRIQSVNGMPSTVVQDVLDVMRRSLAMRIKFFKGR